MRGTRHLLLCLLGIAPIACGQPPDISAELEDFANHGGSVLALACLCFEDLDFSTAEACYQTLGDIDAPESDCLAEAVEGHESEAKDYLDCVTPALETYEGCLMANESCGAGVHEMCGDAFSASESQCPPLPSSVQSRFDACTGLSSIGT